MLAIIIACKLFTHPADSWNNISIHLYSCVWQPERCRSNFYVSFSIHCFFQPMRKICGSLMLGFLHHLIGNFAYLPEVKTHLAGRGPLQDTLVSSVLAVYYQSFSHPSLNMPLIY